MSVTVGKVIFPRVVNGAMSELAGVAISASSDVAVSVPALF